MPQKPLVTIYKAFLMPKIDHGDIIYDISIMNLFVKNLESVQYKAVLAITGALKDTSCDKIYRELELEPLKSRRWYKSLSCMYEIMKEKAANHLINQNKEQQYTHLQLSIVSSTLFFLLP